MPRYSTGDPRKNRHSQILKEVLHSQFVSTVALARQFGVSEVAIRRNLAELEREGLVKRVHGGVQSLARPGQTALYDARLFDSVPAKRAIGQSAAGLIRPGDTLFLDSGTTVLEVARAIPGFLLENGKSDGRHALPGHRWRAAPLSAGAPDLAWGHLRPRSRRFRRLSGGVRAAGLHVNTLFIGTDAVSPERGLTTDNLLEAQLYRLIVRVADQAVVVADSSKIGAHKLQTILPFEEIHTFVTDSDAPPEFVQMLREKGVNVILAPKPGAASTS